MNTRWPELDPYRPGTDGPWEYPQAALLARRAGLGAPPELVTRLLELGPEKGGEFLLRPGEETEELRVLGDMAERVGTIESVQAWWLHRMLSGPSVAREKLALFWHGHFATSNRKVEKPRLMMRQVRLFQEKGCEPFGTLLLEVARDPAMLIWLDGNLNRRGEPNENFARELFELFALGLGNYTEKDIQEAARAFTGWHVRQDRFYFDKSAHDAGEKHLFGQSGAFGGEGVIEHCQQSSAAARLISSKLFEFYVQPRPTPELREGLASMFEECGRNCGIFLRRLWATRLFYSPATRRAIVASPVDYAAGTVRLLGARVNIKALGRAIARMGQDLLLPPNVKGWDGGLAWITSTALLARFRFAAELCNGGELEAHLDWERLAGMSAEEAVRSFFPEGLEPGTLAQLLAAAGQDRKLLVSGCLELPEGQYV